MSGGPPTYKGELEALCRHFQRNQHINDRNRELRRKAFISDYYYQNSTQSEPGRIPWSDVVLVVTEIAVGLMGQ
jgi:hypothetical protein